MPSRRVLYLIVSAFVSLAFLVSAKSGVSQSASAAGALSGTVKSSDGKPLEGVGVSARSSGETFTTTVYTDESGRYSFPAMGAGQYKVWAQAVGFSVSKADADLFGGGRRDMRPFDGLVACVSCGRPQQRCPASGFGHYGRAPHPAGDRSGGISRVFRITDTFWSAASRQAGLR